MKKRVFTIVILIVIICNTLLTNVALADDRAYEDFVTIDSSYTVDSFNALNDDGSAQVKSNGEKSGYFNIDITETLPKTVIVYIVMIFDALPVATHSLMSSMTNDGYEQSTTDSEEGNDSKWFTIESLVKNDRQLFDANYFNMETKSEINVKFKQKISVWFNAIRQVAIIISLLVFIYVGIRMALSTVASEKAVYKKMLIAWFESVILLFIIPYIFAIAFEASEVIMGFIKDSITKTGGFELNIIESFYAYFGKDLVQGAFYPIMFPFGGNPDTQLVLWSIAYCILITMQIRFLLAYAKRFFAIGILILISPLVTVLYAIEKVKEGKGSGFEALMKEFLVNVYIQPIHIIVFEIFIVVAGNIANVAPIIAIAFLFALARVEKIIKTVFNMRGLTSIHSIGHFLQWKKK